MIIKIQTSEKSNGNKGNSRALVTYLEKEDIEKEKESLSKNELPAPRKGFFNHEKENLNKIEVINSINNNKKGLGRDDAKFYSITISPSEKEQKHLIKQVTKKELSNIKSLDPKELKEYEKLLQDYTRKTMNEYAKNFNRKGLDNGNQLLYAGKIEHTREYKGTDSKVKNGLKKSGDKKEGFQTHIHVIVSRKDHEMKYKLSPLAKEKGKNNNSQLNGRKVQRGFDRNLMNIKSEKLFDSQFQYKRDLKEKVEYRIEASKQTLKTKQIELEKDTNKKQELEEELINDYDKRNNYTEKDKELTKENLKLLEQQKEAEKGKENDNEMELDF